jgi:hypothetical protein
MSSRPVELHSNILSKKEHTSKDGKFQREKTHAHNKKRRKKKSCFLFVCFSVLGFELRAYTLSHSTSPLL